MLPFLKDRHEGSASSPVEQSIKRSPDEDMDLDMLSAVADDMMEAFHKKDKKLLKECLEALVEHIQEEDEDQDHEMEEHEGEF